MSKETPISEKDLKGIKLKKTTTEAQKSNMKLVFKCEKCNKIVNWPTCCDEQMELDDVKGVLKCVDSKCKKTQPIPVCHGQKCKPSIVKA